MRERQFGETLRVRVPAWLKGRLKEEAERRAITMGSLVRETLAREVGEGIWVKLEWEEGGGTIQADSVTPFPVPTRGEEETKIRYYIPYHGSETAKGKEGMNKRGECLGLRDTIILRLQRWPGSTNLELAEGEDDDTHVLVWCLLLILEERGLIEREAETKMEREIKWYLTEAGEDAVAGIFKEIHGLRDEVKANE